MAFTTLLESSLPELNQAWKAVDEQPHANRFLAYEQVTDALTGWRFRSQVQTITLNFSDAFSAMRSLKGIGATHLHAGRERKTAHARAVAASGAGLAAAAGHFPALLSTFSWDYRT